MGWIRPTSHNDISNKWNYEANAYDGVTSTSAYTDTDQLNYWLELILAGQICSDKIRLYSREGPGLNSDADCRIEVFDVSLNNWVLVYDGFVTKDTWVEKTLPDGARTVSKSRIRWESEIGQSRKMYLFEFEFNQLPVNMSAIAGRTNNLLGG
jgi:hypothetical protein